MDAFLRDLRCGLRMLLKRKGFTLVVVLTLATGTTTTLFSIVSKMLVTPLAFEAAETIAFVWSRNEGLSRVRAPLTFTEYDDLQREQQSFENVAALAGTVQTLTGPTDPAYVNGWPLRFARTTGLAPHLPHQERRVLRVLWTEEGVVVSNHRARRAERAPQRRVEESSRTQ